MAHVISPREGEEILLAERKSLPTMTKQIAIFIAFIIPAVLLFIFFSNVYVSILALVLLLFGFGYCLYNFVVWYYNLYLVTNMRVIIVVQKGLFHRELSEIEVSEIADVRYQISGVVATILQRGTVTIMGTNGQKYELENVADPDGLKEMILGITAATKRHGHGKDNVPNL